MSAPYVCEKIVTGRPCEVQEVSTRGATGGTFTLTYEGEETADIPWDATADTFQAALEVRFGEGLGKEGESTHSKRDMPPLCMLQQIASLRLTEL